MCGIHLIADRTLRLSQTPILQMQKALQYRGPEAASQVKIETIHQCVFIAQNRLRITDIRTQADTLFGSEDGRFTLAYNGEIYNHQELRTELEKKYNFRTCSDTEVLLYLLIESGMEGLSKVNGMFAFAFYDKQEEKLHVCRDRFGMKPLFYAKTGNYLIISSEIKGILASGLLAKELNSSQIPYYLRFKFARRPYTFFKNIYEIEPGTVYTFISGGTLQKGEKIPAYQLPKPEVITLKYIEEKLLAALQRHLHTEVPAGLFLSGGVDSTLLLALSRELGIQDLPVFSVANQARDASFGTQDYQYARKAAKQFGASYHQVQISPDLLTHFNSFVAKIDQPVGDGAAWLTWILSVQAQKQVKVVLSGAGADEVFAGYHRHLAYYHYLQHYAWLSKILPLLKKSTFLLPAGFNHPLRKQFRLLHKLFSQMSISREQTFVNFTAQLSFKEVEEEIANQGNGKNLETYLRQALHYDQQHFLSADVLAITDRMTMQASLEARMPYLDAELTTLIEYLPAGYLLQKGRKWILKDILTRKGGQTYVQRSKEGFGMPFGRWVKSDTGKNMVALIQTRKSLAYEYISYEETNQFLQSHLAGKADYSSELWTVVLLIAWMEKEFGNEK